MADIYSNPVIPPSPSIDDYYNQSMQRVQQIGLRTQEMFVPEEPEPTVRTAKVAIDSANNKLFIGGHVVDRNDDTNVAILSKYANQDAPLPEGNWEEVDPASFASYVQGIRDPGTLKLMAKNFGMGVDEMQQMAGLGLQWLGAESAGQYLADQEADLAPNQVYSRSFTDIGSSPENGVLDWMAATIGRLGPNIVESTISAAAGAAAGGALSGPAAAAGAPIGAIAGFFGKTAVKKALMDAAKKRLKGEALNEAEKKLLLSAGAMTNAAANASKTRLMSPAAVAGFVDEATLTGAQAVGGQVARRAAQVGGAAGLSTASNIFQQTGQAYGETMAGGGEGDRAVALGVGVLGGLADTIPEFILAGRLFSELGGDVISAAKKQKSALDLLKGVASGRTGRIAKGVGAGAAIEGTTEGFQEVLQIAANPVIDFNSAEGANRVVNAFAAGALMGGVMGGAGGGFAGSLANNKTEANLLLPVSQSDPAFAQYREDLKAQIGDKEVNKIYPPMAPQVMGARPSRAEFDAAQRARMDAITGMDTLREFAGQPPVPLGAGEPTTFQAPQAQPFVPSAERGTPLPGMSGVATGTLPEGVTPTVFPGQPLPPPPAPSGPQTITMGGTMTPAQMGGVGTLEQFQATAMQQAMAAQQAPDVPVQDLRGVGIPRPAAPAAAPLPGGESINARLLRRGAIPQATPPAQQQGTIRQVVEQGPLRPTGAPQAAPTAGSTQAVVTEEIPYDTLVYNDKTQKVDKVSGTARIITAGERKIVVVTINGVRVPFYLSTGLGGKQNVKAGKWYPFFGMGDSDKGPWINKGTQAEINNYYGSPELKAVAEQLDATIGDIRKDTSVPKVKFTGAHIDFINRDMAPADNNKKDTAAKLKTNIDNVLSRIRGDARPAAQPIKEEVNAPKPGAGTGSAAPAGKQGSQDGGPSAGDSLRKGQQTAAKTEEQGTPTRRKPLQAEAAVQPAVKPRRQRKPLSESEKQTDLQQFLKTYADPRSFGGMRENENLADVVEYADWLGSLSKAELAKIEPVFSKRDNPFLNAGSMDVARARAKLEEAISPKAPEVAATSAKTADEVATETDRNVWDDTFDDGGVGYDSMSTNGKAEWRKLVLSENILQDEADALRARYDKVFKAEEKARKAAETAADKARKAAEDEARRSASGDYDSMSEALQNELANDGKDKGTLIANKSNKAPKKPTPSDDGYSKAAQDIYEVYEAISNIITARRVRARVVDLDAKDTAKLDFINSTKFLYGWITDNEVHPQAQNIARAYLEKYVSTTEDLKGVEQAIKNARQTGMFKLSDFDLVQNPIDENGRPAKGVNPIRVKAIVDKFRSGLAKAPTFHVYKNQADLQRRNPALYQQAVGSRPQGDFDTARASGFAFDGKVLVFTDRIPTEKYMRLLLAHESIGHFGMRALLPASKFDALMDYVYDNNAKLRLKVDAQLAGNTDLGARREAVEEYMAKNAEKLDSSVITRVWNAIKDVLNKLGVKFEDDIVRYLVSQARRTVREGSSMFTPSTFALNVHTVTTNNGTGRFSTEPLYTAQHELSNAFHLAAPPPYNLDTARQTLKDYRIDSADKLENFMRNVFRLRNFNALRNHGAQRFEYLKDAMRVAAQSLRNVYNEKLAGLLALSGQSRHVVSYALIVSRRIADRRFMLDKELRNSELIVLGDEQPDGTRALDINKPIFERLLKMGTLSRDELNNGAEVTYEEPAEGGKTVKTTVKIPGVKEKLGRDLTDNEYNIYVKTRRDLAELDVERLKGQLQNFIATEEITTKGIRKVLADKNMTDADVAFVKSIVNHAKKLHLDDIEYDERGMPTLTPKAAARMEQYFAAINNAVVKREFTDDLKAEVRKFYLPKQGRDEDGKVKEPSAEALAEGNKKSEAAIKKIEEFRSRRTEFTGREEQSVIYTLQDRIKEIVLADAAFEKAQMAARRSIGSSHVPLWREGSWQVRVEAQINGRAVKLHPEVQNKLLFSLHTQRSESENAAAEFNDGMKDLEYSGLVYNEENGEYKTQTFKLFAVPSKVVESVASEPSIDIDNFLYTLRVLGQPLAPDKHAKAITMLTAPGSALRKALRFDDTPGYDPLKSVEAIARHVTTRSSLIARTKFQPHMRDLMDLSTDTGKLWFGDAEAVMTAKENLDKATDDRAKAYWQDRLTTDLYKYVTTNPGAKGWDGSRAKFPGQPKQASLGMRDYSDSIKEMEWMQDSSNINESTFEGKQLAAGMKMITSVGFLGGMFTQFAQNLMSPATNVLPYLASKDSQTGFGGGFGMAVMPTYLKAFKDVVGFRGLNPFSDPIKDAEAFDKIASDIKAARDTKDTAKEAELVQQYGLSYYEALNIAREIREGKLIPAQANALLETARGMFTGPISKGFLKFSDVYMSPFNVSEQATRRATFLTAFRLEFDRLKQAGFNEDKASEMARIFAVDTVDKTLGEYSNTNRPPVWRDGWQSLLFVYKTYPLTSLLLFKNMSRAGKIGMLTSLYVLAGAAGFPLVDDMEDFIDTLSQRLGLDLGQGPSIRMAIIRQLEEVFPGWSDMILRGPMNHFTGADVGAKFGLEDFIPGTGILLKGANTTEELKSIAGPVFGMTLSIGKFAYDFGRAPLSSTVSAVDVAREAPFSLVRAAGDVAAYMQNGAIVDRRGYVVTPEVNAMTMLARLAGFYPAEAAKQYDFIKYANRMNYDYKEVGTAYKLAWVKAKMTGDERQAARIVREVNDWNEANRGGPGVIRNFLKNAQRALKEARRPAGERFLKSAPVASRASYDRFLEYITGE